MKTARRQFIRQSVYAVCGMLFGAEKGIAAFSSALISDHKEAYFYQQLKGKTVQCQTCPHECIILPDQRGRCKTKINQNGKLYTLSYGNPCVIHTDPIEKKPLLHFYPGSKAFSLAVAGCNFHCLNCQNWEISQTGPDKTRNYSYSPDQIVEAALKYKCRSIAYTYSEPTTFYEYMYDIAKLAKEANLKNVLVSNAYMSARAMDKLSRVIDGAALNLKAFSDDIYMKLNGGHLAPVLETYKLLHKNGVWMELINLVIPTYTDDPDMIKRMCDWIVENLGADYPLHLSRFAPRYRLVHLPPTPVAVLENAEKIAVAQGLNHVYIGNVPGLGDETVCSNCKKVVIERRGYYLEKMHIESGKCTFCDHPVPGRFV